VADKPADQTDRQRLAEGVHQTDLTESRINEDFVDWLKTAGPTWLLVILITVTAYLALVRFRQHNVQKNYDAWDALTGASLPGSKEDVAEQHAGVFAVPQLALNSAGSQLLVSLQSDTPIDVTAATDAATPNTPDPTVRLNAEERVEYASRADRMFAETIETDNETKGMTLHIVQAYFGRAAAAESEGRIDDARGFYEKAQARAGDQYPKLGEQAAGRMADLDQLTTAVAFTDSGQTLRPFVPPYASANVIPALRELLAPPTDG
jgi:hypothetical protein